MPGTPSDNRQHRPGTYSGYNWHMERRKKLAKDGRQYGKRHKVCPPCQGANASQQDTYRKRVYLNGGKLMVPAAGTRRRLQALNAMGWNFVEIGKRLGQGSTVLSHIASPTRRNKREVYPETAEKIQAVFSELDGIPAPDDWLHRRTMHQARERGCLTSLSWDEEDIDNPYALPQGLTHDQAYTWLWNQASDIERIEWALTRGLSNFRKKYWLY